MHYTLLSGNPAGGGGRYLRESVVVVIAYVSPEEMVFVVKLVGILFLLATAGMIGYVIYYYVLAGLLAPTRGAMARVLYKKQNEIEVDAPRSLGGMNSMLIFGMLSRALNLDPTVTIYHSWDYFITFQFEGKQQEFTVPEAVYASVSEGDEGLLVHKGNLFRRFVPQINEPLPPPQFPPERPSPDYVRNA